MQDRVQGLQTLRAVAALMVLFGHVLAEADHYMSVPMLLAHLPWTRGVDIFFVISGFVVTLSAHRFIGQPVAFLWRRLLRVVPLYYLFTTLMVITLIALPSGPKDTTLDPAQILSSYAFWPYERADGRIAPVLSLGWTLNYEVFFYALLALCLALPRPLLTITAILITLSGLGLWIDWPRPQITFWTNPILLEFLMGIGLARLWMRGWRYPRPILAILTLLAGFTLLIVLHPLPLPRFIAAGCPAMLIVASGTLLCPERPLPWQVLGDASYALYLSHRFTLRAATLLLLPLLPATLLGAAIYVSVVCALSIAVAMITHIALERPVMRGLSHPLGAKVPA